MIPITKKNLSKSILNEETSTASTATLNGILYNKNNELEAEKVSVFYEGAITYINGHEIDTNAISFENSYLEHSEEGWRVYYNN